MVAMSLIEVILITLLVLIISCSNTYAYSDRMNWLISAVKQSLHQVNINSCGSEQKHACSGRDFSNAAVSSYLISSIEDTTINTTGAMHWLSKVTPDGSFVGQGYCALAHEKQFMNALNESSKKYILQSINKALPQLAVWDNVDVSYSNMYFMGMVNAIICGEVPGVNQTLGNLASLHGYQLFENWLKYAATAGNHEYDSPTYYWVQMNALGLGCMYSQKKIQRIKLCNVLEHLWSDVALNWFQPTETLSGSHSRDYDFLYGHGALQVLTFINGLGKSPPICEYDDAHCERTNDGQNALVLLNAIHARDDSGIGHRPKKSTINLSKIPIREIRSKWLGQNITINNMLGKMGDRYNYIHSNLYAIGSSSQDYITNTHQKYYPCPQDKLISIDLASSNMTQYHPIPSITLVHDWLDHPYGHLWKGNPTNKPSHLASHPGNVQYKNILLTTNALNPSEKLDGFTINGFTNLATNVILPTKINEWYIYGEKTSKKPPSNVYTHSLNLTSTIGIRMEKSCLAIRIIACDGIHQYQPTIMIKADATGLSLGAFRLAMYHYIGPNSTLSSSTHIKNGFLMVVDKCNDDGLIHLVNEIANVSINQSIHSDIWHIDTRVRGTRLEVDRNISEPHCNSWECVTSRKINGSEIVPVSLRVNGVVPVPMPSP
jgi:hypothetical protein